MLPSVPKAVSRRSRASWWMICAVMIGCETAEAPDSPGATEVGTAAFAIDLNYTQDEMFGFSIEKFCKDKAPHLLPYVERISHVAGEHRISPRALLALMEQQSGAVTNPKFSSADALGDLSAAGDFLKQLADVSARLRAADTNSDLLLVVDAPDEAILAVVPAQDVQKLGPVYQKLFPGVEGSLKLIEKASAQVPMQFPWLVGSSWRFGGAHADNGSGSTLSSIDFYQTGSSWGDTINVNVVASAGGRLKRHSSCYVEIVHDSTWSTGYYHLSDIMVADGATVKANQPIAKYANNKSQALCDGGSSTGPHVHWTLYSGGRSTSLSGKALSGWTIHPGTSNYDKDCSRMYLSKNGQTACAGPQLRNDGISGQPPPTSDQCPNDPNKTAPGTCGCGVREPVNVAGFRDARGFGCSDWVGYDCTRAAEEHSYTAAGEKSILANCGLSCNVCPSSSGSCTDSNSNCAGWARQGECSKNPGYMLTSCCASCR